MATLNKISPCLGFENKAEDAAKFYTTVFKNSKINDIKHFPKDSPHPSLDGKVMAVSFELEGQEFLALNGYDPLFNFSFGMSLMIQCKDQDEIDYFTDKLTQDGEQLDCGWVRDQFGLCWQIVPEVIAKIMKDPDAQRTSTVLKEVWKMKKLDVAVIEQAYKKAA